MKRIYLAGGCFWGVEHFFSMVKGVKSCEVGYANSNIENPSYEDLKSHKSLASETVLVYYDENEISLKEILNLYFQIIDPTSIDRQGNDIGHQYRTGIYYENDEDKEIILQAIEKLKKAYDKEIVIEVLRLENYYKAEEYHQKYLIKNPNGYCHLSPKAFEIAKNYKKHQTSW